MDDDMELDRLIEEVEGLLEEDEAEDVEGDGDEDEYDEVGARRRRGSRRKRRKLMRNRLVRAKRKEGRDALVGLGVRANVGIAGVATFTQNATRGMQLTDLFIQAETADTDITITSFRISDQEQLLSGEAGASFFNAAGRVSRRQNFDPLKSGTPMTVNVRNDNVATQDVSVHSLARINR